jgi:hypothetical protein
MVTSIVGLVHYSHANRYEGDVGVTSEENVCIETHHILRSCGYVNETLLSNSPLGSSVMSSDLAYSGSPVAIPITQNCGYVDESLLFNCPSGSSVASSDPVYLDPLIATSIASTDVFKKALLSPSSAVRKNALV